MFLLGVNGFMCKPLELKSAVTGGEGCSLRPLRKVPENVIWLLGHAENICQCPLTSFEAGRGKKKMSFFSLPLLKSHPAGLLRFGHLFTCLHWSAAWTGAM